MEKNKDLLKKIIQLKNKKWQLCSLFVFFLQQRKKKVCAALPFFLWFFLPAQLADSEGRKVEEIGNFVTRLGL